MFDKVEKLSLFVYIFKGKNLVKQLCKWSGCDPKVYSKRKLIEIYQNTISDLTRHYHIPGLFWNYFFAKDVQKTLSTFNKEMTEEDIELEILETTLYNVRRDIFNEEDKKRIQELIDEYGIKEVKENDKGTNI